MGSIGEPKHNWISKLDKEFLMSLSWHQLQELNSFIIQILTTKYKKSHKTKYGNMNKGFTEEELKKFFSYFHPFEEKEYLVFKLQALLGLRVGEAIRVKIFDINFNDRSILIHTEKTKKADKLYLHDEIFLLLKDYCEKHHERISNNAGYLVFSDNPNVKRFYICPGYLRSKFREICNRANLSEFYDVADDYNNPISNQYKKGRKLYRLTTHSLRHYYITKIYNALKDPVVTSKLARHTDLKSTQIYIHTSENKLKEGIEKTFE